jgi:hypothetical protein
MQQDHEAEFSSSLDVWAPDIGGIAVLILGWQPSPGAAIT